ncbi:MAG: sec-independent protein translocase protein [Planctomycetota bacterium]|nr:MAG: sec-independent protein translocase protein [Planctomycetota bacterium]
MITNVALMGLGSTEMIVIFGLAVLLFGAAKLPQLARSMGKSINEFKKGMSEGVKEAEGEKKSEDAAGKTEEAPSGKKE